jgi:hypothetical protein
MPRLRGYRDWLYQPITWFTDIEEAIRTNREEVLQQPDFQIGIEDGLKGLKAVFAMPVWQEGQIVGVFSLLSRQKGIYGDETRRTLELNDALASPARLFGRASLGRD